MNYSARVMPSRRKSATPLLSNAVHPVGGNVYDYSVQLRHKIIHLKLRALAGSDEPRGRNNPAAKRLCRLIYTCAEGTLFLFGSFAVPRDPVPNPAWLSLKTPAICAGAD